MKYICLGYYDKSKHDAMTEAEKQAMFDACFSYDDHLRANGHWAGGEALQPAETALTVLEKRQSGDHRRALRRNQGTTRRHSGARSARHESRASADGAASFAPVRQHFRDSPGGRPKRNAEGQRAAPTAEGCTLKTALLFATATQERDSRNTQGF